MIPRCLSVAVALSMLLAAKNGMSWTHMAKAGETLDQLASRYYGSPEKSAVIRAANGFIHPDDGRLAEGEAILVPEVRYVRTKAGETWESLADAFLSARRRGVFLAEMNEMDPETAPPLGTIIKIPFHLRHIFAKDESLRTVMKLYRPKKRNTDWLRNYNNPRKKKYGRGEVIIVPLLDLDFTEQGQAVVDEFHMRRQSKTDMVRQQEAIKIITELKNDYEKGAYVAMVAKASRLLGYGSLTITQEIGVYNFLAYAYTALGEMEMAIGAFKQALSRQPEMELSTITTSPKILSAFKEAKRRLSEAATSSAEPSQASIK